MKIIGTLFLLTLLFSEAYSQNGFWVDYTKAPSPFGRGAFATSLIGDKQILLFGGMAYKDYYSVETWLFDFKTLSWSKLNPQNKPEGRYNPGMCQLSENLVLMFGGMIKSGKFLDETWLFDLSDTSWTKINTANTPPERYWFGLCEIKKGENRNNAILFGGSDNRYILYQDTWIFDSELMNWKEVLARTDGGNIPSGRSNASLVQIDEKRVFLLGGQNFEGFFPEIWEFNTDLIDSSENTVKWKKINTKEDIYFTYRTQKLSNNILIFPRGNDTWFYFINEDSLVINYSSIDNDDPGTNEGLTRIDDGIIFLHGGQTSSLPDYKTSIYYDDESLVSVDETTHGNKMSIYPNPANDFIEIENNGLIKVYDMLGELVYSATEMQFSDSKVLRIDISHLPKGIYFIQSGYKTAKFIKI